MLEGAGQRNTPHSQGRNAWGLWGALAPKGINSIAWDQPLRKSCFPRRWDVFSLCAVLSHQRITVANYNLQPLVQDIRSCSAHSQWERGPAPRLYSPNRQWAGERLDSWPQFSGVPVAEPRANPSSPEFKLGWLPTTFSSMTFLCLYSQPRNASLTLHC